MKYIIKLFFILTFFNCCKKADLINDKSTSKMKELDIAKAEFFKGTPAFELVNAIRDNDDKKIYDILKKIKNNIDCKDVHNGYTALMYATIYKKNNAIKILLENGANPNLNSDKDKVNAFFFALNNTNKMTNECNTDVLNLMLKYGANVNNHYTLYSESQKSQNHILNIACTKGCLNIVKLLVDKGADINYYDNKYENSPVLMALYQDNLDIVRYLIIERKAKIPKVLFTRNEDETESGEEEKVDLKTFLNEQDYTNNPLNNKIKNEIISYISKR